MYLQATVCLVSKKGVTILSIICGSIQPKSIIDSISTDALALIIAILALILSAWQWIRVLKEERFSLNIKCSGYQILKSEKNETYRDYIFGFIVDNLSSLPISISYISFLSTQNKWIRFCLTKRFMKDHFIPPGLDNPYRFFTSEFPVNIGSYSSALIYVTFESMDGTEILFKNGTVEFTFTTSRKEKTLTLDCQEMPVLNQ